MLAAPLPPDETARLQALYRYDVLDTSPEEVFDRITRVASTIAGVPIALISLVDAERQWFKSKVGLDVDETPRELSFCAHAILSDGPFVVPDATQDERFHDHPAVSSGPTVRFYMGIPLEVPEGPKVGTLCVVDRKPRRLSKAQQDCLNDLAHMVVREMELRRVATTDALTGALNRRMSLRMLSQEASRAERSGEPFCFAMVDLDHFKRVNDTWGHDAGDVVLAEAARVCREVMRAEDTLFRLGGEEFGILFVGADLGRAAEAAERVRERLAARPIVVGDQSIPVTASIGVAQHHSADVTPPALIARADKALYAAKAAGRNRVMTAAA